MQLTDYFNQSLEEKTDGGWNKLRKRAATGMTLLMLSSAGLGLLNKPSYATPNPAFEASLTANADDQSIWNRIMGVFKKKDKKKKEVQKTEQTKPEPAKQKSTPAVKPEDYIIKPLEVIIGNNEPRYVRQGETTIIPYDQTFSVTPQVNKAGMRTEFLLKLTDKNRILNDKYQTDDKGYITDRFGHKIAFTYGRIDLDEFGIEPGEKLEGQMTYEKIDLVLGTAKIELERGKPALVPQTHAQTPKEEPKPCPKPVLDKMAKSFVSVEERHSRQRAKSPMLFSLKGAYVLESESFEAEEQDPGRTGKGWLFEGLLAGKNYQLFGTGLSYSYDDRIPVFGGSLKQVFSEFNAGLEFKVLEIGRLGFEYIHTNKEWVPVRYRHVWTPYMDKFVFNSFSGGVGLGIGDFNKSFIEGLIYYGKGNLKEVLNLPGREELGGFIIESESITEKFYKIHGRAEIGPLLLKGIITSGSYDNASKTLDGVRDAYSGEALVSLGLLSDSLKNVYVGAFVHHLNVKQGGTELFTQDLWGPILIINIPLDSRK